MAGRYLAFLAWLTVSSVAYSAGQTITVNTENNVLGDGLCSFPEAALAASNLPGYDACPQGSSSSVEVDTIRFQIGTGHQTITLSDIVHFLQPTFIDGSSQNGFSGTPLVHITGNLEDLLRFAPGSDGSTLKSMRLTNLATVGIDRAGALFESNNNRIVGNYFNVNRDATSVVGEKGAGLLLGSHYNTIGGSSADSRNLFGGEVGIYLQESSYNLVEGNYFGVQPDGITPLAGVLGAGGSAIQIYTINLAPSRQNTVRNNIITGFSAGINLSQGTQNNIIHGNHIGVAVDGSTSLPNANGVLVLGASSNTIGGTTSVERNIISGNSNTNITIQNYTTWESNNNIVQGNYIGPNSTGSAGVIPPAIYGIQILSGQGNTIGGIDEGTGNLIGGNSEGILVGAHSNSTNIRSNQFGVSASGINAIPNVVAMRLKGGNSTISNNYIANSTSTGIFSEGDASIEQGSNQNCFLNNSSFAVNHTSTGPNAALENNWWGSSTGPGGAGSGSGDWVSSRVNYTPYLKSRPGCPEFISPVVNLGGIIGLLLSDPL